MQQEMPGPYRLKSLKPANEMAPVAHAVVAESGTGCYFLEFPAMSSKETSTQQKLT